MAPAGAGVGLMRLPWPVSEHLCGATVPSIITLLVRTATLFFSTGSASPPCLFAEQDRAVLNRRLAICPSESFVHGCTHLASPNPHTVYAKLGGVGLRF